MKIHTTGPGKGRTYTVKPLDELTLADWVVLTQPDPDADSIEAYEQLLRLVSRHTTLPRRTLNKMPAVEVRRLVDAMAATLDEVVKAKEKAETASPKSFTLGGVVYFVPQSIESDLTFGQYESLTKVLLPKCKTDADGYAAVLAVTCLPDGEEFDGAKIHERQSLFMSLPLRTAFDVCAFFFDSSEQLRSIISHIATRSRNLYLHRAEQALRSTPTSTAQ